MTRNPHKVRAKDNVRSVFSPVDGESDSDPINLYPNKPGKINEIAVDPVAPTIAKTSANDLRVAAK